MVRPRPDEHADVVVEPQARLDEADSSQSLPPFMKQDPPNSLKFGGGGAETWAGMGMSKKRCYAVRVAEEDVSASDGGVVASEVEEPIRQNSTGAKKKKR